MGDSPVSGAIGVSATVGGGCDFSAPDGGDALQLVPATSAVKPW